MDIDQDAQAQAHDLSVDQGHTLSDNPTSMPPPNSNAVAEAFERRLRQQRSQQQDKPSGYVPFDEHHERRQMFRRMIDPGILRPNARPLALESLRVLLVHTSLVADDDLMSNLDSSEACGEHS